MAPKTIRALKAPKALWAPEVLKAPTASRAPKAPGALAAPNALRVSETPEELRALRTSKGTPSDTKGTEGTNTVDR